MLLIIIPTSLPKVIWEEGRIAVKVDMYAIKSPLVTMACPEFAAKSTDSRGPIPKPCYLPHPCTRPTYVPNGIQIRSAFFHNALDRPTHQATYEPTHRPTNRPTRKSDHYMPLCYDSDAA